MTTVQKLYSQKRYFVLECMVGSNQCVNGTAPILP